MSSGRVVTWAKAAAGKRSGPSGTTIGKASVQWAFAEAVVLFLRDHPAGQKSLARLEKKHGPGKACTVLAQHVARAVYALVTRETVCDRATCLHREGSGGGAPAASLGPDGISRETVLCQDASTASLHA